MQVKIFEAENIQELEKNINAWLADENELKAIVSHEFKTRDEIKIQEMDESKTLKYTLFAFYHWMTSREVALMQAQNSKIIKPQ